jgi:hypothetical protein
MNRLSTCCAVVALTMAAPAAAQMSKTLQGETKIVTTTVEAIDHSRREVTAKKPDGTYDVFYVPPTFKRFDTLKIGDKITATYYENIVLRLKTPGAKDVDAGSAAVTRSEQGTAATAAHQRTITATIAAIDRTIPSITFTGPNNWTYSTRVEDKAALAKVKVGDKLDITWTEALILSLEDAK